MATTTNYGWTTPDDTALVKDGASAIRTLGSSVDTTTKALNPSTTLGDIEYRSSTANTNTRLGIGTSGQALTVVAGAPSWAASPTSVLTTTGDSLYASAANTLARLGIGSTGQVLTVAAGVPSWATPSSVAASFSLLNAGGTALSGASSRTISGISGMGTLMVIVENASCVGAGGNVKMRLNGDTGSNYWNSTVTIDLASTYGVANFYGNNGLVDEWQYIGGLMTDAVETSIASVIINGCNSSGIKIMQSVGAPNSDASANRAVYIGQGQYRGTSTISSVTVSSGSGNFDGGTVYVYGSGV